MPPLSESELQALVKESLAERLRGGREQGLAESRRTDLGADEQGSQSSDCSDRCRGVDSSGGRFQKDSLPSVDDQLLDESGDSRGSYSTTWQKVCRVILDDQKWRDFSKPRSFGDGLAPEMPSDKGLFAQPETHPGDGSEEGGIEWNHAEDCPSDSHTKHRGARQFFPEIVRFLPLQAIRNEAIRMYKAMGLELCSVRQQLRADFDRLNAKVRNMPPAPLVSSRIIDYYLGEISSRFRLAFRPTDKADSDPQDVALGAIEHDASPARKPQALEKPDRARRNAAAQQPYRPWTPLFALYRGARLVTWCVEPESVSCHPQVRWTSCVAVLVTYSSRTLIRFVRRAFRIPRHPDGRKAVLIHTGARPT